MKHMKQDYDDDDEDGSCLGYAVVMGLACLIVCFLVFKIAFGLLD